MTSLLLCAILCCSQILLFSSSPKELTLQRIQHTETQQHNLNEPIIANNQNDDDEDNNFVPINPFLKEFRNIITIQSNNNNSTAAVTHTTTNNATSTDEQKDSSEKKLNVKIDYQKEFDVTARYYIGLNDQLILIIEKTLENKEEEQCLINDALTQDRVFHTETQHRMVAIEEEMRQLVVHEEKLRQTAIYIATLKEEMRQAVAKEEKPRQTAISIAAKEEKPRQTAISIAAKEEKLRQTAISIAAKEEEMRQVVDRKVLWDYIPSKETIWLTATVTATTTAFIFREKIKQIVQELALKLIFTKAVSAASSIAENSSIVSTDTSASNAITEVTNSTADTTSSTSTLNAPTLGNSQE